LPTMKENLVVARQRFQFGVHALVSGFGYGLVSYHGREAAFEEVRRLRRERRMLLTPVEAHQIFSLVKNLHKIPGELAEVGVFQGASARLIHEASDGRPLHLFDTFEGLPLPSRSDLLSDGSECDALGEGWLRADYEKVLPYLAGLDNVHLYKGIFPETSGPVANRQFSFVHLDMDLYEGTLAALEFFYPRMAKGGVILSHDYVILPGPTRAFQEYFAELPSPILELPGAQCMAVKI